MKDKMNDNQNTDKIDMSEINIRFREEKNTDRKEIENKNTKNRKFNAAPLMSILVILLTAFIIVLVYITISNNKSLNNKINSLMNNTEATETEIETQTEESKSTEKSSFEESEERSGKLIQDLNFRSGPGYDYDVIGTIPAGTEVEGYIDGGWLKIEYNGKTGYIGPQYLE
ncbi:SH3 domain-containing protein [Peptostreptococcaceae bacterium OttesenSCG-928-C18]|nr:SH3 domain-containing protein [Peptostreptococcaceae bacterium OttesenSCG-928-C18]